MMNFDEFEYEVKLIRCCVEHEGWLLRLCCIVEHVDEAVLGGRQNKKTMPSLFRCCELAI